MSLYENVYTDAIKDVVGDEPVLDQFDIQYEASFYGTMQDDYVTGTLINKIPDPNLSNKLLLQTGERGRAFSKLYASSQPPLDSTYGSQEVNKYPRLSLRTIPWSSRVSRTAGRISQAHDANERYYDSCLPDFAQCVASEGLKVWSIANRKNALSPYVNVVTSSVGHLLFDSIEIDRSEDGYTKDPTVFNGWTRSFPFDAKYSSAKRLLAVDNLLGLRSSMSLNWNIPKMDDSLLNDASGSVGSGPIFPSSLRMYDDRTVLKRDDIFLSSLKVKDSPIDSFIPIIPGYVPGQLNGLRQKTFVEGGYGEFAIHMGEYAGNGKVAQETGYSLLFPSDVDLSKKNLHTEYLDPFSIPDPGMEYLTGSMSNSDLVKFIFGFGDFNNVTYARRNYEETKKKVGHEESFENYADETKSYEIPDYKDENFKVSWSAGGFYNVSPSLSWRVSSSDGTTTPGIGSNFGRLSVKSGSISPDTTNGITWISSSYDQKILVSNQGINSSEFVLTVTSSYPWSFSYDRAICGNPDDYFMMGIWGVPGDAGIKIFGNLCYPFFYSADYLTGSGQKQTTMTTYDYMVNGTAGNAGNEKYPLPPGSWNIFFSVGIGATAHVPPTFAAVNNFKFYTFSDLEKKDMIGSNNLPEFSLKLSDRRIDPTYQISPSTQPQDSPWSTIGPIGSLHLSGSSNVYGSYVFGVSPVIRGWKYGLINGYPQHSKVIFRRGRYGQYRDMLEQRQYTKFINSNVSPADFDAVTTNGLDKNVDTTLIAQGSNADVSLGEPAALVKFVRKITKISQRGIGTIDTQIINPDQTTSQNLSFEVTSSLPYFDLESRHRSHEEMMNVRRSSYVDTVTISATDQQLGIL